MTPEYGTALYYPYIDIDDSRWLRTAILFWEQIQTIVPSEISHPYANRETRLLQAEGLLTPLACNLRGDLLQDLGRRVIKYIERPELSHGVLNVVVGASHDRARHPGRLPGALVDRSTRAHLHRSKMSPEMLDQLIDAETDEAGFLLVDGPFAAFYMSALANRLARETGTVAVSNDSYAFGIQLDTMLDEVLSDAPAAANGILMSAVFESLTVDASVPLERVVRFRHRNENRLRELGYKFGELSDKIGKSEDLREIKENAGRFYVRTIRTEVEKLKASLEDAGIGAIWTGVRNAVTLSSAAGTAINKLLGVPANIVLGAGAFVTIVDIAVQAHLAGRKIRRESPFSYLLDVERRFALPSHLVD